MQLLVTVQFTPIIKLLLNNNESNIQSTSHISLQSKFTIFPHSLFHTSFFVARTKPNKKNYFKKSIQNLLYRWNRIVGSLVGFFQISLFKNSIVVDQTYNVRFCNGRWTTTDCAYRARKFFLREDRWCPCGGLVDCTIREPDLTNLRAFRGMALQAKVIWYIARTFSYENLKLRVAEQKNQEAVEMAIAVMDVVR